MRDLNISDIVGGDARKWCRQSAGVGGLGVALARILLVLKPPDLSSCSIRTCNKYSHRRYFAICCFRQPWLRWCLWIILLACLGHRAQEKLLQKPVQWKGLNIT
ncbi:hypothetical protein M758_6G089300 [Ceratodon purpureus]|nr:hypothetical protein M758_6G089300 [Ceratodon purpureus]